MKCPGCDIGTVTLNEVQVTKTVFDMKEDGTKGEEQDVVKTSIVFGRCDYCEVRYGINHDTGDVDFEEVLDDAAVLDEIDLGGA